MLYRVEFEKGRLIELDVDKNGHDSPKQSLKKLQFLSVDAANDFIKNDDLLTFCGLRPVLETVQHVKDAISSKATINFASFTFRYYINFNFHLFCKSH